MDDCVTPLEKKNAELVFGLVYGIGTDSEEVVSVLEDYLKQFGYEPSVFRISKHLEISEPGNRVR